MKREEKKIFKFKPVSLAFILALALSLMACSNEGGSEVGKEGPLSKEADQLEDQAQEGKKAEEEGQAEAGQDQGETEESKSTGSGQISEEEVFDFFNADMDLEVLKAQGLPMILTFGDKACMYCEQIKPHLQELNEEYKGQVIIKYVDTDEYPEVMEKYPIMGMPASMVFTADGQPYDPSEDFQAQAYQFASKENSEEPALTLVFGYMDKGQLEKLVEELI